MLDRICLLLVIIGSLNWGLVGIFQFDLVAWIFGGSDALFSNNLHSNSTCRNLVHHFAFQKQRRSYRP